MSGSIVGFLGGAIPGRFPNIPQQCALSASSALFAGTVEEYVTEHPIAARLLRNKVKKCASCHKPNGFTLKTCNQCGVSLVEEPICFTPNVFMAFALGIAHSGTFPLTISARFQNERIIVMDDLLALSPLHFNVIPTDVFVPDWRYLLRRPSSGLELVDRMMDACLLVAKEQFLSEDTWRAALLRHPDEFDAERHFLCGFNFPPSQYQLHIQFICPNLMPFQHAQFLNGVHFTYKRFFPFDYVRRCLELLVSSGASPTGISMPQPLLEDDADVEDIIRFFETSFHHNYDAHHGTFVRKAAELSARFSNWSQSDFSGAVVLLSDGAVSSSSHDGSLVAATGTVVPCVASQLAAADKITLQNYGRPYDALGRPVGTYYGFPKTPNDIDLETYRVR